MDKSRGIEPCIAEILVKVNPTDPLMLARENVLRLSVTFENTTSVTDNLKSI